MCVCVHIYVYTHINTHDAALLCLIAQNLYHHKKCIYWIILHHKYVIINIVFNFNAKYYNMQLLIFYGFLLLWLQRI